MPGENECAAPINFFPVTVPRFVLSAQTVRFWTVLSDPERSLFERGPRSRGPPRSVNNGPSAREQISTDRIWLAVPKPTERQRNGKSDQSRNDAEHFVGELGPTFPVVRSTSESTPQTERPCAEKLAF